MKQKIAAFIAYLSLLSHVALAQSLEQEKQRAYLQLSPFHTIYSHYTNLNTKTYNPERAAYALYPEVISLKQREELAIKLRQILDGNGLYPDESRIPKELNYVDSTSKKSIYRPFPRFPEIYVEKIGQQWFYSRETVSVIDRLHDRTFPFETHRLLNLLPHWSTDVIFLGLSLAQYGGIIVLIVAAFALNWLLRLVLGLLFRLVLYRFIKDEAIQRKIKRTVRPLGLLILFWVLSWMLRAFLLPASVMRFIVPPMEIALIVFAMLVVVRGIELISEYLMYLAKKRESESFQHLIPFIETFAQIVVVVISLFYILQNLNFNATALVAGLSIGGLAIALAAQETIKNLFGSITIFADRPFKIGDWIVAEGVEGDVEEIGFRSTRIRTFNSSVVYIPNGRLADLTIDNLGLRIYRRFRTFINITYDTPVVLQKAFVEGIRKIVELHPQTRKDFYGVHINEFGASSINILLYIYFIVADTQEEWKVREQFIIEVFELAEVLGVRFAYPTQTLHIESMPGKDSLSPTYQGIKEQALQQRITDFIQMKYPVEKA